MSIEQRIHLIKKIIIDLELLIEECWQTTTKEELKKALEILQENENLEGYDD